MDDRTEISVGSIKNRYGKFSIGNEFKPNEFCPLEFNGYLTIISVGTFGFRAHRVQRDGSQDILGGNFEYLPRWYNKVNETS